MQALDTFNTAVVSPIYYVMFTSLTIVASVIMFKVIRANVLFSSLINLDEWISLTDQVHRIKLYLKSVPAVMSQSNEQRN